MEPWFQMVVTIMCAVVASSGFWAYIQKKSEKKDVRTQMLIGLAHDRIIWECPTSSGDGSRRTNMKICTIISTSPMKRWAEMAQLKKSCRRSISCPFTNQPIFKKISRRN